MVYQVMAPHSPEYLVVQWGFFRSSVPTQYLEICRSRWSQCICPGETFFRVQQIGYKLKRFTWLSGWKGGSERAE